jgi:hypothetical protein
VADACATCPTQEADQIHERYGPKPGAQSERLGLPCVRLLLGLSINETDHEGRAPCVAAVAHIADVIGNTGTSVI